MGHIAQFSQKRFKARRDQVGILIVFLHDRNTDADIFWLSPLGEL